MLSSHLGNYCLDPEKFSFMERCYHSDKRMLECVPRHTNPTRWSAKKWDSRSRYLGSPASFISSFGDCQSLLNVKDCDKSHSRKNLWNFVESGVYKLIWLWAPLSSNKLLTVCRNDVLQNWLWETLVWTLYLEMLHLSLCCSSCMRKRDGESTLGLQGDTEKCGHDEQRLIIPLQLPPIPFPSSSSRWAS